MSTGGGRQSTPDDQGDHEITRLLAEWVEGRDDDAFTRLWPLIERDLAILARAALKNERRDHTLQPTALISEAFLKLCGRRTLTWENRSKFFATASDLMRKILVSHARQHKAAKRGAGAEKVSFEDVFERSPGDAFHVRAEPLPGWWHQLPPENLLSFEEALQLLDEASPGKARLVEMKVLFGLTGNEIAEVLGVSRRSVDRDWKVARMLLAEILDPDEDPDS